MPRKPILRDDHETKGQLDSNRLGNASKADESERPWGYYEILTNQPDHKVKRIVVRPGKRLSLQRHTQRFDHWFVVSGTAVVTRDRETIILNPRETLDIPIGAIHRVYNPGEVPLVFIEIQVGDYFGEDDIERLEDDFGRI